MAITTVRVTMAVEIARENHVTILGVFHEGTHVKSQLTRKSLERMFETPSNAESAVDMMAAMAEHAETTPTTSAKPPRFMKSERSKP
mmetsp:Transcript_85107/g.168878  ORF Transcript_85107/g.168878 Transcript_85107/m.168878 type:complete len:87 (+) Transcript_85107:80-340(+)